MSLLAPGHDFWRDALCREIGPDLFFIGKGESTAEAKAVCARCDVRQRCLEWALDADEPFVESGVFGGKSPRERRAIRVAREREEA